MFKYLRDLVISIYHLNIVFFNHFAAMERGKQLDPHIIVNEKTKGKPKCH